MRLTMNERQSVIAVMQERYRKARKKLKRQILDECCQLTVFLRRAAVRSRKKCASADESSQSIASCGNGWSKYLSSQMKR
jgi:hypothetical protein